MRLIYFFLVCVGFYEYADGLDAPFITPCHADDPACMKSSAQKAIPVLAAGVPSLGIHVMDPMKVDRVATKQAGLNMDFRNTVVKGLRHCVVESLKREGQKVFLELKCSVIMIGDYNLSGKLLILPIEGEGKYMIKIRDILVKILFEVSEREVDGVKYWNVHDWKHSVDVLTSVEFNFQNLFNGDKALADSIHQFANKNWREIFRELAPPIVKAIVTKIVDETKKLFDKVPEKDLALS